MARDELQLEVIRQKMWDLHKELVEYYLTMLKESKENKSLLKGSTLDAMRQFLKDNAIFRTEGNQQQSPEALLEQFQDEVVCEFQDEDYFNPDSGDEKKEESEQQEGKAKGDYWDFKIKH